LNLKLTSIFRPVFFDVNLSLNFLFHTDFSSIPNLGNVIFFASPSISPLASLSNWLDKEYLHKRKNIQNAFLHLQQETNIECSVMILGSEPFLYWSSDNNNDKQLGLSIHNETFEHATENDWKYSYVNFICAKNEINKSFGISETVNQHLNKQIIYPNNGQHYYVDANKQGNINFTQKDIDIVTTRNRPSEVNYITQQYNA